MDAGQCQGSAAVERLQRRGHDVADGCEHDGGVEWFWWRVVGVLGRGGAEFESEVAGLLIAGHHVQGCAQVQGDLCHQVGAATETVQTQTATRWQCGSFQCPKPMIPAHSSGASSVAV